MSLNPAVRFLILIALILLTGHLLGGQSEIYLDGQWEIIFDERNEGREANWMVSDVFDGQPNKQSIKVPSAWELLRQDYEGVAFYRHDFEVPENWNGKIIRLQFDAVNYRSEVWLNDEVVGFHEGGFTPFEFRVDEMIKPGEINVLTLRVAGPIVLSQKEIDGVKRMETPQWRGGLTGGIWQSVRLVATGDAYVDDVYIHPRISSNSAGFEITLDHTAIKGSSVTIEIKIHEAGNPSIQKTSLRETWELHPGTNKGSWTLDIPDAVYWSPSNPHLYAAKIAIVLEGEVSDRWSTRFGMRELTIKNKDYYLNGQPIYIKATFFEGLYPNGIAFPDTEEMARREIQLAKDAGFNMIRPWRRPPVAMWLDLADEMGVLVVGSPALECMRLPLSTPYLPERVENEVKQAILRDRNRASVVQWELFNELHRPVLKQLMRPMAMLARDLDPTRLILDESGGWAFGANMYLPYEYEPTKFNDIHNYPGPFIDHSRYDGFLSIGLTDEEKKSRGFEGKTPGRNVVPGLMSFVSELGYGSLPDLTENNQQFEEKGNPLTPAYRYHKRIAEQQQQVLEESGFKYLYPQMKQFYLDQQNIHGAANKRMIEAVRANPDVDGYCIHALAAGDWILGAGLIDLWRNPKSYAYEATKAANQPQIISIRTKPRNVYAEKGARLEVIGINDLETKAGKLSIEIQSDDGEVVFAQETKTEFEHGVSLLIESALSTESWEGSYVVRAKVESAGGEILTENSYSFDVFKTEDMNRSDIQVAVVNKEGPLASFLEMKGVKVVEFSTSNPRSTPVFVTGLGSNGNQDEKLIASLTEFSRKGGTTVFIDGFKESIVANDPLYPFSAKVHPAQGLWTCIPHLVHKHPFFEGLPSNSAMRNEYENVWATRTLRDLAAEEDQPVETVVGAIGFDWFSEGHKMQYSGPGDSWWGSDMAIIPSGKGRYIISQLRLVENLDKDPVADKILFNLIRFISTN